MRWGRFAILTLVLLATMVVLVPLLRFAAAQAAQPHRELCQSHLRQLGAGLMMYSQDYDDRYPPANGWSTVLLPYLKTTTLYQCPADAAKNSFAMNANLDCRPMRTVAQPATLAALFESNMHVAGAAGRAEAVADPPRHFGTNNYVFADGHVAWLPTAPDFGKPYTPPPAFVPSPARVRPSFPVRLPTALPSRGRGRASNGTAPGEIQPRILLVKQPGAHPRSR
jgi:prepilin-type processing-associated H-X9-DG protein